MNDCCFCILVLLSAAGAPAGDLKPGGGADSDPTTYSFFSDNRLGSLSGPDGSDLRGENVPADYGRHFAILADGLDVCSLEYAWKLGYGGDHPRLQPRYRDLSRWESVQVENGWVAIDPTIGRFKFAAANQVKDPLRLEHRKEIVLGNLTPWRLEARGKFAFTVGEEEVHAVQAFDASDGKSFRYGGYSPAGGYPFSIALGENHAFVSGSGYLSVHDIRDGRDLKYVKTIATGGSEKPFDICADRAARRLYLNSEYGLQVFDLADEDDPELIDIHEGVDLPFLNAQGDLLFGLKRGEGSREIFSILLVYRRAADRTGGGGLEKLTEFPVAGKINSTRAAIRHLLVADGLAFLILTTGLHILDVRDPLQPKRLAQIHDLSPVPEYYEKGSGAHDLAVSGGHLFVACGHSQGSLFNPRETGLFRDHVDFDARVRVPKEARDLRPRFRGGLRVYSLANPSRPELVTELDDELIGYDAITNVAVGDGVLFLMSRSAGVIAYDLADVRKPRFLGVLSATGEVDWVRLLGDRLYAVSNGLYVMRPYPAEAASLEGFCFTNSFMFGRAAVMNPFPAENPERNLFVVSGTWHRRLTVKDPARPLIADYSPPPVGYGRWRGKHLFVPGNRALDIHRVDESGKTEAVLRFPVGGPSTHLEIHGDNLFLFGLVRDVNESIDWLQVFDVRNAERPKHLAKLRGPTDLGAMFSSDVFYYRGFIFVPGWQSGRIAGGDKGWGNFLGVRVVDVRDPLNPRVHCLIHHIPPDVSVESLSNAQAFHAEGDTLYIADYWNGIHAIDISELAEGKRWRHLGVVKDRRLPWSVCSYAPYLSGYGRHLYSAHFGHVNIWEIPAKTDVPAAPLAVRFLERGPIR